MLSSEAPFFDTVWGDIMHSNTDEAIKLLSELF